MAFPFEFSPEANIDAIFKKCRAKAREPREKIVSISRALPKVPPPPAPHLAGNVTATSFGESLPPKRALVEAIQLNPKKAKSTLSSESSQPLRPSISTRNQTFFSQSVMKKNKDGHTFV